MGTKDTVFSQKLSINCNGRLLSAEAPLIMGILNLTPDSFYDGGQYTEAKALKKRIDQIIGEGADIIDVGACSSRPGATNISEDEELRRLLPALEYIRDKYPEMVVSVDTFRSGIAYKMRNQFGVDIINDISGGSADPEMAHFISESKMPYILMHMHGMPENMQNNPQYEDVVNEVLYFLQERIYNLTNLGAGDIIIDPGFGFGKSLDHNYQLLKSLDVFKCTGKLLLVGISRKSMIYKLLNINPEKALNGTSALHMYCLMKGANILRVHDVREAVEVRELFSKIHYEN